MLLMDVAETSAAVADTPGRLAKTGLLAACLRRAAPDDVSAVVAYLSGELPQRRTGLGYAALRELPPPAGQPTLTVTEVDAEFAAVSELSGKGSTTARRHRFARLMARATPVEQRLLAGLVSGELRQGALDGVLTEAVASAAGVPSADVRRAVTLAGALTPVAQAALADGPAGLERFRLVVGTPLRPMLAQSAPSLADALTRTGPAALEWKLDGVRVQIHRTGDDVRVFTRTLDDVTERVPELVATTLALPATAVVLDGEAVALDQQGRPQPFQRTASRVSRRLDVTRARTDTPLSLFLFDCLHLDGTDLVGRPAAERFATLAELVPEQHRVPRLVTDSADPAQRFYDDAVALGHEGVVAKALNAPYEAGRRGAAWVKVKPRHTLDLVVLAAEWGHGRRRGYLSNLHLGARDPAGRYGPPEGFVMLGKTFKGLTDAMLRWQTDALLALATGPTDEWVVRVRPELVVEIAFDGVQRSPRYPAEMALRFARVLHHRPDKPATEADTVDAVEAVHRGTPG
ncbi:MAG TPA: ATP-dependent DNA ligase [Jiangellaceae bacterium]|nr:ATP-dependent DNA ligase [Jiangellaceae bacterium]